MTASRLGAAAWLLAAVLTVLSCAPSESLPSPPIGLDQFDSAVREQYAALREEARSALVGRAGVAEALGRFGQWHHLYGFSDVALQLYQDAASRDPNEPKWPYFIGILHARDLRNDEAAEAFGRVLQMAPKSVPTRVRLAEVEMQRQSFGRARELLESALAIDSNCVRALSALGRLLADQGDPATAVETLQRAVELRPTSDNLRYELGMALRKVGDKERAEAQLAFAHLESRIDGLAMDDPWGDELGDLDLGYVGNLRRAREALKANRPGAALEQFRTAVLANAGEPSARLGVVRCLVQLDRWDQAWREADSALEDFGGEAKLWFMASRACEQAPACDRDPDALLARSLELDPGYVPAILRLARRHTIQGDTAGAIAALQSAHAADPTSEPVILRLAELLNEVGRTNEAIALLRDSEQVLHSPWAVRLARQNLESRGSEPDS